MDTAKWILWGALTLGIWTHGALSDESPKNNKKQGIQNQQGIGALNSITPNSKNLWKHKERLIEKEVNTLGPWIMDCSVSLSYAPKLVRSRLFAMYFETDDEIVFCKPEGIKRFLVHEYAHHLTDDVGLKGLLHKKHYTGTSWANGDFIKLMREEETPALKNFRQSYLIDRLDEVVQERLKQTVTQIAFMKKFKILLSLQMASLTYDEQKKYVSDQYTKIKSKHWQSTSPKLQRYKEFIAYLVSVEKELKDSYVYAKGSRKNLPQLPTNSTMISSAEHDFTIAVRNLYNPKEEFARYSVALNQSYVGKPTYERWPLTEKLKKAWGQMMWKNKPMWAQSLRKLALAERMKVDGIDPVKISERLRYATLMEYKGEKHFFPGISPKITLRTKINSCSNKEMLAQIYYYYK